jgi:hypothetical protein
MDEMPKQLIAETRIPLPACEGHPVLYRLRVRTQGRLQRMALGLA